MRRLREFGLFSLATLFTLLLMFSVAPHPVHAATFTVLNAGDAGADTLRQAIINANGAGAGPHDIVFDAALAGQTVTLTTGEIAITQSVTINTTTPIAITIDGNNASRIFTIGGGITVMLNQITLQNGLANQGGAINNAGTLSITNSVITGNTTTTVPTASGGGIYTSGSLTLTGSTVQNNNAVSTGAGGSTASGGGVFNNGGTVSINGGSVSTNAATGGAANFGGGLYNSGGTVSVSGTTFNQNQAAGDGGGIYNLNTLTIANTTFTNNQATGAGTGGAIIHTGGSLTATTTTFSTNTSPNNGQAILISGGSASVTCSNVQGNGGGAPVAAANITATSQDFRNNFWGSADGPGGAGPGTGDTVSVNIDFSGFLSATATATDCPSSGGSGSGTSGVAQVPAPPTCNLVSGDGFNADGLNADGVYCMVLMRANAWQNNMVGSIPQALIDNGVIIALEVFRYQNGQSVTSFPGYQKICLAGTGRFIYLDSNDIPRHIIEMRATSENGYTCAWIPSPGTVALIGGGAP